MRLPLKFLECYDDRLSIPEGMPTGTINNGPLSQKRKAKKNI